MKTKDEVKEVEGGGVETVEGLRAAADSELQPRPDSSSTAELNERTGNVYENKGSAKRSNHPWPLLI
jgi:hypothetical protein